MRRRFVVTGATRGIGRATAVRLAEAGHDVVGVARRGDPGFPGAVVVADLFVAADRAAAIEQIRAGGAVDGLVNNAGIARGSSLQDVRDDELDEAFDLNVRTAVEFARAFCGDMTTAGWGRIVNISTVATVGLPGRTAYAGAKAALEAMTRVWAIELAPHGVTVNTVAPGPTATEMFEAVYPPGSAARTDVLSSLPVGRIGRPEEIAALVAFLCSDDAGYLTGQNLRIDGGRSLGRGVMG